MLHPQGVGQSHDHVLNNHCIKRNQDQGHTQETSPPKKDQSQGHIQKKDTTRELFPSHDHVLVHTAVGQGQGHLVIRRGHTLDHQDAKDHAVGHARNLLYLEVFEGFPHLAGKEI